MVSGNIVVIVTDVVVTVWLYGLSVVLKSILSVENGGGGGIVGGTGGGFRTLFCLDILVGGLGGGTFIVGGGALLIFPGSLDGDEESGGIGGGTVKIGGGE